MRCIFMGENVILSVRNWVFFFPIFIAKFIEEMLASKNIEWVWQVYTKNMADLYKNAGEKLSYVATTS
jgi:hypothetical protein